MIYVVVNLSGPTTDALGQAFWIIRSVKATKSIHAKLLTSIFASTFRCVNDTDLSTIIINAYLRRWLDITPVGRIVTRYCHLVFISYKVCMLTSC